MKRRNWMIGSAVFVLAASLTVWLMTGRASNPRMERYLPPDTLAFVETANLSDQVLRLVDTRAWKEFSQAYPELATGFLLSSNYSGLLKADVALAITEIKEANGGIEPTLTLLAESSDGAFDSALRSYLGKWTEPGARGKETTSQYKGHAIHILNRGDRVEVAHSALGGLHVFSNREAGIRRIIDIKEGEPETLAQNPRLATIRERIGNTDGLFGFVDAKLAREVVAPIILRHHRPPGVTDPLMLLEESGCSSIAAAGFSSSFESEGAIERCHVAFSGEPTGLLATELKSPGLGSTRSVEFVPADAEHVFTTTVGDLATGYDQIRSVIRHLGHAAEVNRFEFQMSKLGIQLPRDLSSALGHEATFAEIRTGDHHGGDTLAIFEARDASRLGEIVKRATEAAQWRTESSTYRGVSIQLLTSKSGDTVHALALLENSVLWSSNPSILRRSIDAKQDKTGLAAAEPFRRAFAGNPSNILFRYYGSNDRLLPSLAWSLAHRPYRNGQSETKSSSLFPTAFYGAVEPGGLYVEGYSPVGAFSRLLLAMIPHIRQE